MRTEEIAHAVILANAFVKKAAACIEARSKTYKSGDHIFTDSTPKESGAVRRASMDLTRQLAEMRKP